MQFRDVLSIIGARWKTLVACLLLVLAATAFVTWRTTPVYEAHASVFFASTKEGYQVSKQDLGIFAKLLPTPTITDPLREELHLPAGTPISVSGATSDEGPFLDIVAHADNAQEAADIANAAGPVLAKVAGNYSAQLAAAGGGVKANPISPATPASSPITPNVGRNALIGVLAGLGLGVGVILLRHFPDGKVRTDADIRAISKKPVLAHLRRIHDIEHQRLIVEQDPHSLAAEEFRKLRTNVQFVEVASGGDHSFLVTSPSAGEGKTTVAVNLALAMAAAGSRTLLIDADLRHPSVAPAMGLEGGVGLTTVLLGRVEASDVIEQWKDTNLYVLPAGETPPNPAELLGSEAMRRVFASLSEQYDFILVDTPPVGPVIDPVLINRLVGGMLMVVTAGQTSKRDLSAAIKALDTVKEEVSGFALNQVRGGGSYYAYGSKEAYYGNQQGKGKKKRSRRK